MEQCQLVPPTVMFLTIFWFIRQVLTVKLVMDYFSIVVLILAIVTGILPPERHGYSMWGSAHISKNLTTRREVWILFLSEPVTVIWAPGEKQMSSLSQAKLDKPVSEVFDDKTLCFVFIAWRSSSGWYGVLKNHTRETVFTKDSLMCSGWKCRNKRL